MLRIPAEEDRQEERGTKGGGHVFIPSHLPKVLHSPFFALQYCGFKNIVISNIVASVHFMLEFTGFYK